ncbi:MAG: hypothetical protein EHM61_09655 [Acidobacteria bacterium]|nr:MAG: hypothetical protein EHM61_09655 [Acidobacteriota bacterium]
MTRNLPATFLESLPVGYPNHFADARPQSGTANEKEHAMKRLQHLLAILVVLSTALAIAPVSSVNATRCTQADITGSDLHLQFSSSGHILGFRAGGFYLTNTTYALHVQFVGATPVAPQSDAAAASGERGAPPPLRRVTYANLWDGITLTYEPVSGGLTRSTYRIEPGADTRAIHLRYNVPVRRNADRTLTLTFATGRMTESAPIAWQEIEGQSVSVPIGFQVFDSPLQSREVGFRLGAYDSTRPLFIDPTLTWNTFLGGSSNDYTNGGIAVDGSGNVYVTGYSTAAWQGATPPRRTFSGEHDAFAAKLDASGDLVWNTFLGGIGIDIGEDLAVDGSGNVYVTGYSDATWQGATEPRRAYTGNDEAFAAKLDANGDLVWNTFLGPGSDDYGAGITVDGTGNVYVTGESSATWLGVSAPQRLYSGGFDAFAAKLDTNGDLTWNTFLGGTGNDYGRGIALDGSGNVYLTGYSDAMWQGETEPRSGYTGGFDAFAAKLDTNGHLAWNTFLGGIGNDNGEDIAVDGSGNVYMTGHSGATWQGTAAPGRLYTGNVDAFVAKLDANGDLTWNTFLGGNINDLGFGIAVDGSGNVYVTGRSNSTWQGANPPQPAYSGDYDAFAAKLDTSGNLNWNAFLGAGSEDMGFGIAVDGSSNVYVTGYSNITWQGTIPPRSLYSGGFDVFAAKLAPASSNADLSDLVLSSGTLNPAFASATTSYTAAVANDVTSITVTPSAVDAGATIRINGTIVDSGGPSGAISLHTGDNIITTIVTAGDGVTSKTYTVIVNVTTGSRISGGEG